MIYAGTVTEVVKTVDDRFVYRVVNSGGHTFFPVHDSGLGGFHAIFSHTPIMKESEVLFCELENKGYYIIGGLADPRDLRTLSSEEVRVNEEVDVNGVNLEDTHIRNTNSYLTLSHLNGMVLKGDQVRIQLSTGSLRVSKEGVAENQVLNGQPFLDALFTYISEMENRLNILSQVCNVVGNEILNEYNVLIAKQTSGTITPNEIIRLTELTALGVANPTFSLNVSALNNSISPSSSSKSQSESTLNTHIKIP